MRLETITEDRIALWTEKGSCCELDLIHSLFDLYKHWSSMYSDLNIELPEPLFWFARLKAKVEGQGEGTKMMRRLVQILDEKDITVINGVNPYGSMDLEALTGFYKKYGFEDIDEGLMLRRPNATRV